MVLSPIQIERRSPKAPPEWQPFLDPSIYWIVGLALFVRFVAALLVWHLDDAFETPLTTRCMSLAANLADHAVYSESSPPYSDPATATPPGYPFFLALQWRLIGESRLAQLMTHCLLGAGVCALVFASAYTLMGRFPALVAGWLTALDPTVFLCSLYLAPHSLYLFFLALAAWAVTLAFRFDHLWAWALGGGAAGLAALTWPDALWIWTLVVVGVAVWRRGQTAGLAARVSCFLAVFACVVGLWTLRNYSVAGRVVFVSDSGERWVDNRAAFIPMRREGLTREEASRRLQEAFLEGEDPDALTPARRSSVLRSRSVGLLLSSPVESARLLGHGLAQALLATETDVVRQALRIWTAPSQVAPKLFVSYLLLAKLFQVVVLAIVLAGAALHRSWRRGLVWWAPVLYLLYMIPFVADLETGPFERATLAPAVFLLAALELDAFRPWLRRRLRFRPERFGRVTYGEGPVIDSGGLGEDGL